MASVPLVSAATGYGLGVLLWLVSLARRDASIVDPAWGPMFLVVAGAAAFAAGAATEPRALLILALVAVWSLRLGSHLLRRYVREGEDSRYRRMREKAGEGWWWKSLFKVFLLQATIMLIVAVVLIEPLARGGDITALAWAGTLVAVAGIVCEAMADEQLRRFKKRPDSEDKVMDEGLWSWSRHPNYFGDALFWWGMYVVALGVGGAWWSVFSPIVMTFLLIKVSGIPMLEDKLESTRPGYKEYARRTSAFIPMPPKRA